MLPVQEPRLLQSHSLAEAPLSAGGLLPRHGGCEERAAVKEGVKSGRREELGPLGSIG